MRRYIQATTLLASLLSIEPAAASDGEFAKVHTVAVISVLGSDIEMQTTGFMAFHDYELHTDWNFDALIVDQVTKALSGHFVVKSVTVDPKVFGDFSRGTFDNYWSEVEKSVMTLPKANGVDAYIVVFPEYVRLPGGMGWQGLIGSRAKRMLYDPVTTYGAYYLVSVVDANTGKRIDWATSQYPSDRTFTGFQPPVEKCANEMWADTAEAWTTIQSSRVRQEITWLIDRSIFYTLASANVISLEEAATDTTEWAVPGDPSCQNAFP